MQIEYVGKSLTVCAPAKVNLFLEVLGKLPGGYHAIDTLMCPIDLHDRLTISSRSDNKIDFRILLPASVSPSDVAWHIPVDSQNLVVRAIERVRNITNRDDGCNIVLEKNIPAAAGLGGGSSDAAAAIVASMAIWGKWDRLLAKKIASELGSDISFFFGDEVHGVGLARGTGRGEIIQMLDARPELHFAIAHPIEGCSTARVYSLAQITRDPRCMRKLLAACGSADFGGIGRELFNALEEPASQVSGWISKQLEYFKRVGAQYVCMTGSGSACFALAGSPIQAEELAGKMLEFGLPRAYDAKTWYARSIESQLSAILGLC